MSKFQVLSQRDPRWKKDLLGFDKESTIGGFGCLVTSMAMVANAYGFDETPVTLNKKFKNAGGFQGAYVIPAVLSQVCSGVRYTNFIQCRDRPAPLAQTNSFLSVGKPVIVELDISPKDGLQNHWLVLHAQKGADYLIWDPWPYPEAKKDTLLTKDYGFAGDPSQIITSAIWFDGSLKGGRKSQPAVSKPTSKPSKPLASFSVYATADDLALRQQTYVAEDNLIKRLPLNAELGVLDSDEIATQRIGVVNEWLNVRDAEGYEGYAAAWYLSKERQEEKESGVAPSSQPVSDKNSNKDSLTVKTIADGVALRRSTVIADSTLIKHLPEGAALLVLEDANEAKEKIGVEFEWLMVKDIEGAEGYIAAWYVSESDKLTLGVKETKSKFDITQSPKLIVRPITEYLALRTRPFIAEKTLIKYLPLNSELIVLDLASETENKIGVVHQWLQVRDIQGAEGYVAAWYVMKRPG